MSMATEIIAAVEMAQRNINDQIARLQAYQSDLNQTESRIEAALAGSTLSHHDQLLEQLSATKRTTQVTIEQLVEAQRKLDIVKQM